MMQKLFRIFLFAAVCWIPSALLAQEILVRPYIQPGNASDFSREEKVLIWQTNDTPANFKVTYAGGRMIGINSKIRSAKISSVILEFGNRKTILYRARLPKLLLDSAYVYDVSLNNKSIASNWFRTRTTGDNVKFVMLGDCCQGTKVQAAIANEIYKEDPQFAMVIGDVVYEAGLEKEYRKNYFPYYLATEPDVEVGAPLLSTIPFYNVIGNHDVLSSDLDKFPDGLAYFYYHDLPLNAPRSKFNLVPKGNSAVVKKFKSNNRPRFPSMTNYSFTYGNVIVVALDSNPYANPMDPALVSWMTEELTNTNAEWKIVAFHHPGFNSSPAHSNDQFMRLLSPVLQQLKVDLVFSGHVHNYQRTVPLQFAPNTDESGKKYIVSDEGWIDGTFTLDQIFDGVKNTKPAGIIYIVSGAGGASLYDFKQTDKPELWLNGPKSETPFIANMVSDRHSFTLIETRGKRLTIQQKDENGNTFDKIIITR